MSITRTSFKNTKIYFYDAYDLVKQINKLKPKNILSIKTACPDFTTTMKCSNMYYEFYVD